MLSLPSEDLWVADQLSVKYIDQRVTKGAHYVTCEIAANSSHPLEPDSSHFRLVAVMAT